MYVEPDQVARIVVNERTGTIVIGQHVRISTVAVAHGGLSVVISEAPEIVQPQPFSETGETRVAPRTGIGVEEGAARTHVIPGGVTVSELANALNALGASPRDIIAILQAIKTAGALQAELTIM
jgi:flagellar P-ring protein precursor FlgI